MAMKKEFIIRTSGVRHAASNAYAPLHLFWLDLKRQSCNGAYTNVGGKSVGQIEL
jgi:hypothetical protein